MLLLYFLTYFSRIVTEKPYQGSVNKVLYCIVLYCTLSWSVSRILISHFLWFVI